MHTILIIEDEESLCLGLKDRLTMEGFRVRTASNGEEGIRQVLEEPPDLILCDIMMPGMDGYSVLAGLQSVPQTATIPFIFLTAKADPPQVRAGMELGADDYLCKPVTKTTLLAAIRARLEKQQHQDKRVTHEVEAAHLNVVRKLPHELLSPLTALLQAGQRLEAANPTLPLPGGGELGRIIRVAAQRLHRIIRRVLLYADQVVARDHPEAQARMRGTSFIAASPLTADLAQYVARQSSRAHDLQLDLGDIEVAMDATHFSEVVTELVDNAFKFSLPGSVVRIRLNLLREGGCLLEVRDQGRGMTPDQVRQVGAFQQFDSEVWGQTGTGLGLVLVKQLASLYGGSLTLESEPGNGTRAVLRLPQARLATHGLVAPGSQLRGTGPL